MNTNFVNIPLGPTDLVIIQATSYCNMDCRYCYLTKQSRQEKNIISFDTISTLARRLKQNNLYNENTTIAWHAGEPLTAGLKFFEKTSAIFRAELGLNVKQNIQTNGTLINRTWCDFFKSNNFSIGVSIDGPEDSHDANRIYKNGVGSYKKTLRGISLLKEYDIDFSTISVLTRKNLSDPKKIYDFFKNLGASSVGFNTEEHEGAHTSDLVTDFENYRNLYKNFYKKIFELNQHEKNKLKIREIQGFDSRVKNLLAAKPQVDVLPQEIKPYGIITISQTGDFSTFSPELLTDENEYNDFKGFSFGNVHRHSFDEALKTSKFKKVYRSIRNGVSKCRDSCDYYNVCGGLAPANKLKENKTFDSTETNYCQIKVKDLFDTGMNHSIKVLSELKVDF